ncbi:CRISPR-associated endonuclease Cas1 [Thermosyntropha sp.]|uniref:CRISPR-associated endonuclease Cas1 n=1 Tax=Thermosyntropha sp. TaxID=2740820 RepID=UPI0025D0722D|nr:CRISPR-associated endonuclease Cas1 [Thermosyntropha sp.]MBO8159676.1 CRISPR-associated endonuclease Cas1 [Thermosyntropha sp.]
MILYVNEAGLELKKNEGYCCITKEGTVKHKIPLEKLEAVVLFSGTHITTPCLRSLLVRGIPVTFLSSTGEYFGRAESTSHFNMDRQLKHFKAAQDPVFSLNITKSFITGKVHNSIVLLRRYNRGKEKQEVVKNIKLMQNMLKKIPTADSPNQLNGIEGYASRLYFEALSYLIKEDFYFCGRSKQPPRDPFNSLLSFGYTLLLYEIYTSVTNKSLHPYLGFLHQVHRSHPALASDLMEEWRPIIVDSLVLNLINHRIITLDDFSPPASNGGIYLKKAKSPLFIEKFAQKLKIENRYLDGNNPCNFRQAINHQVDLLVKALETGDYTIYKPVIIR